MRGRHWAILVLAAVMALNLIAEPTYGHLRYVINGTEVSRVGTGLPYSLEQADQLGLGMLAGLLLISSIQLAGPRLSEVTFFVAARKFLASLSWISANVARVLVGLLLLASWRAGSLLTPQFSAGPQLGGFLIWLQFTVGLLYVLGVVTPLTSVLFALVYFYTFVTEGVHGLDHFAMLGLAAYLFIEGGGNLSLDNALAKISLWYQRAKKGLERYRKFSLLALRITLGVELVWLGLTEKVLAPALTSYAITKYGVPYFPDLTVFTFVFGVFEIVLGFHFVLGLFNRVVSAVYLGLLLVAIPIFGEWINHFYLFAAVIILLIRGAGSFKVDVRFVGEKID